MLPHNARARLMCGEHWRPRGFASTGCTVHLTPRPGAEATLPVDAVGSAAKPLEADAMAGPDRGGLQNDLNSPRGLQFKIMIGSAGPNCSYTYYILRRLNTTRAPLKTSHQA